jgi:cytochrome b6-f complex iron-sulfur subunit
VSAWSRRQFLGGLVVIGAGGAISACGGAGGQFGQPQEDVSAGNVSALTQGDLLPLDSAPVIVGRDAGGVYAMTSLCTHEGCDMIDRGSIGRSGVFCSCHGSEFDANGKVLAGPARSALPHFEVAIAASGEITVKQSVEVDASVRAAV